MTPDNADMQMSKACPFLADSYCAVLCNGAFPASPLTLTALRRARSIVCCDGAAAKLAAYGREPDAIVGDLDSLPDELKTRYRDRIFHDPDQETNDQTKAVRWCSARGLSPLVIFGATGLREDHTIANIALLADYADCTDVVALTDTGVFVPVVAPATFRCRPRQQISIFAIDTTTKITTHGLKYEVAGRQFTNWNQGALNEAVADTFSIATDGGKLVLFFQHTADTTDA